MSKIQKPVPRTMGGFVWFILGEIRRQRKWLLFPLWVLLGILALMMVLGGTSSLLPVIYLAR